MLTKEERRKVEECIVKGYIMIEPEYLKELQQAQKREMKRKTWGYRIMRATGFVGAVYVCYVLMAFFRLLMV